MKTSLLRYAAIGMTTVSMAGFAAASTVTFDTTGADSNQQVHLNNQSKFRTANFNGVGVASFNAQAAASGNVSAYKNTSVDGNVGSGDAQNDNTVGTTVMVSNTGVGAGLAGLAGFGATSNDLVDFSTTGADSNNQVTIDNNKSYKVTNENVVQVENVNYQAAQSGNVKAVKNTTVGGLTSGAASNMSNTTTTVHVNN